MVEGRLAVQVFKWTCLGRCFCLPHRERPLCCSWGKGRENKTLFPEKKRLGLHLQRKYKCNHSKRTRKKTFAARLHRSCFTIAWKSTTSSRLRNKPRVTGARMWTALGTWSYADGYHSNPEGIPVLVDAIHNTGVLEEQTEPDLILSDSSMLGFTGQDVGSSRTSYIC